MTKTSKLKSRSHKIKEQIFREEKFVRKKRLFFFVVYVCYGRVCVANVTLLLALLAITHHSKPSTMVVLSLPDLTEEM